ncbi:hypothetical protein [[Pseudomonas] boreopolis]|uniref:Lipoprotein n=1 Tax=Xanthomonas boreopolis TaxID=86183 RepID=A0A919FCR8_9XANT|nr:hypothetical protein GCM10009090_38110 [[Pseudomonas] boreopolis]
MKWLFFVFLISTPLLASCNTPKGRYQSAVIEDSAGGLCFKIEDTKEARRKNPAISGVGIGEQHSDHFEEIWLVLFPPAGIPEPVVSPDVCIPYEKVKSLPKLQPHKAYILSITGSLDGVARFYSAKFCMIEQNGDLRVQQVTFDSKRKLWNWDKCGIGYPVP